MWIADQWKEYELLDCSRGEKLERWGKYTLVRPDPQAIWDTPRTHKGWTRPDARYARGRGVDQQTGSRALADPLPGADVSGGTDELQAHRRFP